MIILLRTITDRLIRVPDTWTVHRLLSPVCDNGTVYNCHIFLSVFFDPDTLLWSGFTCARKNLSVTMHMVPGTSYHILPSVSFKSGHLTLIRFHMCPVGSLNRSNSDSPKIFNDRQQKVKRSAASSFPSCQHTSADQPGQ